MKINHLKLKNYRCFNEINIDFHSQLTLIVAKNGMGKTTILDALKVALWAYVSSFDLGRAANDVTGIQVDDVRLNLQDNGNSEPILDSAIEVFGDCFGITQWKRYRESVAKNTKTKDDNNVKKLKTKLKNIQAKIFSESMEHNDLPIICYYGTGRLWSQKKLTIDNNSNPSAQSRTFAYRDCVDPSSSFKNFADWYRNIFMSYREAQIKIQEKYGYNDDSLIPANIINPVKVIQQAVNQVLCKIQPDLTDIEYSVTMGGEVVLNNRGVGQLKVGMLSDGVRNIVSLVADIAYRCYKLNPHLGIEACLKAPGVILVDEIDMHLHPAWQQTIVSDLQLAFPDIQWIMTTHSPQVLSTVKAESIRVLDNLDTLKTHSVSAPSYQTQGISSFEILMNIQNVPHIPDIKISQDVKKYRQLIEDNQDATPEAKILKQSLIEHFGGTHPVISDFNNLIQSINLRNKIAKLKIAKSS